MTTNPKLQAILEKLGGAEMELKRAVLHGNLHTPYTGDLTSKLEANGLGRVLSLFSTKDHLVVEAKTTDKSTHVEVVPKTSVFSMSPKI